MFPNMHTIINWYKTLNVRFCLKSDEDMNRVKQYHLKAFLIFKSKAFLME